MADLNLDDFTKSFLDSEIIKVELETMNGDSIYLRSLSRANIVRFRSLSSELTARSSINIFYDPKNAKAIRESDLDSAEDFLVIKSLCNNQGELLFSDEKHYKKWSQAAGNEAIQEILHSIDKKMVVFYGDTLESNEDLKKKSTSSE